MFSFRPPVGMLRVPDRLAVVGQQGLLKARGAVGLVCARLMQILRASLDVEQEVATAPCVHPQGGPPKVIPTEARPIIQTITPAFIRPTLRRFGLLMGAAFLCTGRRTVANLLRVA